MIEKYIAARLWSDLDVVDRVGDRIAPGHRDQYMAGEMIIIREISRIPEIDLGGESGLHDVTVQIDCYAESPASAFAIAELVRNSLSGLRASIGDDETVFVQSVRVITSRQLQDAPADSSDVWTYRYSTDYAMHVSASIPTN